MSAEPIGDRIAAATPLRAVETPPRKKIVATPYVCVDPTTLPPEEWLLGYELLRGIVTAIVAPGGTGKSFYTISAALALTSGRNLLGKTVHGGPKKCWLVNLEDSRSTMKKRIEAARKLWHIPEDETNGRLFMDSGLEDLVLKLVTADPLHGPRVDKEASDDIVEAMLENNIDVLFIDPVISAHAVNENDNGAIDMLFKELARIAERANAAICVVHHVNKVGATNGEITMHSSRGASSAVDACRCVLVLNRMTKKEAEEWKIPGEERRRYFRVYPDKGNRAPPADDSEWYFLRSLELGNGDNIGVCTTWTPPDVFDGVSEHDIADLQREVDRMEKEPGGCRAHMKATRWAGFALMDLKGLKKDDHGDKLKAKKIFEAWTRNGCFELYTERDEHGVARPDGFVRVKNRVVPTGARPVSLNA